MLDNMVTILNLTHNLIMPIKNFDIYELAFKLSYKHNFYKIFVVIYIFFSIKTLSDVILLK